MLPEVRPQFRIGSALLDHFQQYIQIARISHDLPGEIGYGRRFETPKCSLVLGHRSLMFGENESDRFPSEQAFQASCCQWPGPYQLVEYGLHPFATFKHSENI